MHKNAQKFERKTQSKNFPPLHLAAPCKKIACLDDAFLEVF